MWRSLGLISELLKSCRKYFKVCKYAAVFSPMYLFGQIGFLICSKTEVFIFYEQNDLTKPKFLMDPIEYKNKYYTPEIHESCFVLPYFAENALDLSEDN